MQSELISFIVGSFLLFETNIGNILPPGFLIRNPLILSTVQGEGARDVERREPRCRLSAPGGRAEIKGIDPRNILYTVTRTIVLGWI